MDMEHIKLLKTVHGTLVLTTMTLLTFESQFVTFGNSHGKHTVSLLCYSRPQHNIRFLYHRSMAGLQYNSIYNSDDQSTVLL
jgi:hypothetical protein